MNCPDCKCPYAPHYVGCETYNKETANKWWEKQEKMRGEPKPVPLTQVELNWAALGIPYRRNK